MSASSNEIQSSPLVGAALSFVEGEFGGPVDEAEIDLTLAANTVTKAVGNNPERLSLLFMNLYSYDVYVSIADNVSSTHGIYLPALGGYLSLDVRSDQLLPTREWFAIAPSGAGGLYVLETKRYALSAPVFSIPPLPAV